ncbi:MAG: sigma-54-dependent Fis family transcriptional regulator [Myxococcales bacterium]|nr:sigma-54-dependent Fis family transcriptional regulator [Myxococcales bacterium]
MSTATLVLVRPDPAQPNRNHAPDVELAKRCAERRPCWILLVGGVSKARRADAREKRHDAMLTQFEHQRGEISKDGLSIFAPSAIEGDDDPDTLASELAGHLASVGLRMPLRQTSHLEVHLASDFDPGLLAAVVEVGTVHPKTDIVIGDRRLSSRLRWETRRDLFQAPPGKRSVDLVGRSPAIEKVRRKVERYADQPFPVLIIGETGTGKEIVANMLHQRSARQGRFMAQNAAQLPAELADSLLFGHRKGAFTGADADRPGRIREAEGGTFFLDEVFNLAPPVQGKLLRALNRVEHGVIQVEPVGSTKAAEEVHVRLVVSALKDPRSAHESGGLSTMREDLFYRVGVGIIRLPPLRQLLDDLPALCADLLQSIPQIQRVSDDGIAVLREHQWPGNVRELKLILLRAAMDGPPGREEVGPDALRAALGTSKLPPGARALALPCDLDLELKRIEVATMLAALRETGRVQAEAGRRVGMYGKRTRNFGRRLAKAEQRLAELNARDAVMNDDEEPMDE